MTASTEARPLVEFPAFMRSNGFQVSPDQTVGFLEAAALLGPRGLHDVRRAAIAMFAVSRDREPLFEALFRMFFLGESAQLRMDDQGTEEDFEAREDRGGDVEARELEEAEESGREAAVSERLGRREFGPATEDEILERFVRLAPYNLPTRNSYRYAPARKGDAFDIRRTLRAAVRQGGEPLTLSVRQRKRQQRRIVLLIDVSGSMRERTASTMRFAHALVSAADRIEVFTLGTRLTRITPALAIRDRERALARVGTLVADFDGGTRIGEALHAFLAVPRFAGFARGAVVAVLSDGLERGGPDRMVDAVRRLARDSWRLHWLTPLAADLDYSLDTAALSRARPYLDWLGDGSSLDAVASHFLNLSKLR